MVAKIDIQRMFASVTYDSLIWRNLFLRQVVRNKLDLVTIRREDVEIFLYKGVLEGAATSIVAIALLLSLLIEDIENDPRYHALVPKLEADALQPSVPLCPHGWLDDWLLFASDGRDMLAMLEI